MSAYVWSNASAPAPAQYFPALFTQVYQGNRWCAARCQVHLDQQPSLFGKAGLFFGNWALVQTGAKIILGSACERLQNMIQWKWVGLLCVPRQLKGVWGIDMPASLSFSYSFVLILFKQIHIEILKAAIGCLVWGGVYLVEYSGWNRNCFWG